MWCWVKVGVGAKVWVKVGIGLGLGLRFWMGLYGQATGRAGVDGALEVW